MLGRLSSGINQALGEIQWVPRVHLAAPGEREIQFSAEEIGYVDEVLDVAVSACSAFGELDFVVDAFQEAIGQAGLDETHDAGPVGLDRLGELYERLDAGTLDRLCPGREMGFGARRVGIAQRSLNSALSPLINEHFPSFAAWNLCPADYLS